VARQRRPKRLSSLIDALAKVAAKHADGIAAVPPLPDGFNSKSVRAWTVASQCDCAACQEFLLAKKAIEGSSRRVKQAVSEVDGHCCSRCGISSLEQSLHLLKLDVERGPHFIGRCVLVCPTHHPRKGKDRAPHGSWIHRTLLPPELRGPYRDARLQEGFSRCPRAFVVEIIREYVVSKGYKTSTINKSR
jgi:hypothetical protein